MKIWFISKYASPPKYSKMPSRLFNIAREVANIGHESLLITSDSNHFANYPVTKSTYNFEEIENVPVIWVKTKKYKKTASIQRIISWLDFEFKLFRMSLKNLEKPDVVHISSLSIFTIIYGIYLKYKFKSKLVFEIRDIWPLTMTEEGGFNKWHPLVLFIGLIERIGYQKSDLIVGTMPNLKAHVEQICKHKSNVYCLPIGYNPSDYEFKLELNNNPFKVYSNPTKMIIGYAGSMGITNALETFIDTIKSLRGNANIKFLLVGSGDLKLRFQNELKDFENVKFLDRINQNDVKFFLEICDVLYLSTQKSKVWDYGQSMNKVVEYMLAAKPIVATYSGYPSMINEANCGCFIDEDVNLLSRKFIELSLMSKTERNDMGLKGRTWIVENRSYSKLSKSYISKLESILID